MFIFTTFHLVYNVFGFSDFLWCVNLYSGPEHHYLNLVALLQPFVKVKGTTEVLLYEGLYSIF